MKLRDATRGTCIKPLSAGTSSRFVLEKTANGPEACCMVDTPFWSKK
jgi:hypothetical protein